MHDNHDKPALLCDSLPSSGLQHALQVVLVLLLLVFDSWQTVSAGNLSENLSAMWCQCPSDSTEKHQEASCSVLGMMRKMSTVAFLVFAWLGRSSWSWFLEGRNLKGWRCHSSSAWNLLTLHLSKQRRSDLYWGHVFQFLSKSMLESSLRNRPKEPCSMDYIPIKPDVDWIYSVLLGIKQVPLKQCIAMHRFDYSRFSDWCIGRNYIQSVDSGRWKGWHGFSCATKLSKVSNEMTCNFISQFGQEPQEP